MTIDDFRRRPLEATCIVQMEVTERGSRVTRYGYECSHCQTQTGLDYDLRNRAEGDLDDHLREHDLVKALWIPVGLDVEPQVIDVERGNTEELSRLVGGPLERVIPNTEPFLQNLRGVAWRAYANEEHWLKGTNLVNVWATELCIHAGWSGHFLVGDVVILGHHREDRDGDVPQQLVDALFSAVLNTLGPPPRET